MNETSGAADYEALLQFLYRSPVGLIDADETGEISLITPMAAQLLLPMAKRAELNNLFDALEFGVPQLRDLAAASPGRGAICSALRFAGAKGRDGEGRIVSLSLFRGEDGRLTAVLHDASREERRQRRRIEAAALTDRLTGLPNRQAVHDQLGMGLATPRAPGRVLVVLFVNCDRFQHINDTAGHGAGDALLMQVAERLRNATGTTLPALNETLPAPLEPAPKTFAPVVGRVGGDEFAVVVELDHAPTAVHAWADRLMQVLSDPYRLDDRRTECTFSLGLAIAHPADNTSPARCLYDAHLAMTEAKRDGGARFKIFDDLMSQRMRRRVLLENDLGRAIPAQQLHVAYQPVIRLRDGRVAAMEALVRWNHPTLGPLSPAEFIGIAEDAGLISALGRFVLDTACRQFMLWRTKFRERAPALLAVNLSRAQLPQPTLASDIAMLLDRSGMEAHELQLEVTESLAAQDEGIQMRLHELKRLGLTLALDDFGTGYSSLASLYQLPVDVLKIDRAFVSQLETSAHHRALVEATIKVAQSLRFETVAEGIETEAQAQILLAMGCDKGQGYFFSPPLLAEGFERWLESREATGLSRPVMPRPLG